jgi:hypothetical protein
MRWTLGFVGLLVLSLAVLATPGRFEGPILLIITPNHGITLSDVIGLSVLSVGWLAWGLGIWRRRRRVDMAISAAPRAAALCSFLGGLGVGLVIASTRTSFLWLALGAGLLTALAITAAPIVSQQQEQAREQPPDQA